MGVHLPDLDQVLMEEALEQFEQLSQLRGLKKQPSCFFKQKVLSSSEIVLTQYLFLKQLHYYIFFIARSILSEFDQFSLL